MDNFVKICFSANIFPYFFGEYKINSYFCKRIHADDWSDASDLWWDSYI